MCMCIHIFFTYSILLISFSCLRFNRTLYEAYVEENSSPGQRVTNLFAFDPDSGGYGALHFNILHQTSEGAFTVDKEGTYYY